MRVMSPGRVKGHREFIAKVEQWQVRVGAPSLDRGEDLSDVLRIAALVQMLPGDMRDAVCQRLDARPTCRGMRDNIRDLVAKWVLLEDPRSGISNTSATKVIRKSTSERSATHRESATHVEGRAASRENASRQGAKKGTGKRQKGKGCGVHGKGRGTLRGPRLSLGTGSMFMFCTCKACGGWGHCQAVVKAYVVDQV